MSVAINGYVLTVRTLYESGTVNQYHAQDIKEPRIRLANLSAES